MNYYERHLGDYAKNCGHLTLLEHGVYVRLLDVYYTREQPIPDARAAKLIGAATPETLQALQEVLFDFFELRDGYWHQDRCDAEIEAYRKGEPEREVKRANEDNRLKRHREERSKLFKVLTDRGEHASWNIQIADLRKLVSGVAVSGPETLPATRPATAPATPATATQSPVPIPSIRNTVVAATRGSRLPNDWSAPKEWLAWAREERPELDPLKTAERFKDFWISKPGASATKANWQATWRNWVRNEKGAPMNGRGAHQGGDIFGDGQ